MIKKLKHKTLAKNQTNTNSGVNCTGEIEEGNSETWQFDCNGHERERKRETEREAIFHSYREGENRWKQGRNTYK